ncbi:MAG: hypothetical protein PX635_03645 [Nostocales cyanobacterium LE14-WE12]|jgi:hypothetical protein|nr:hypothetical protein [Nostocales cyanobacterium LE14-WE12]
MGLIDQAIADLQIITGNGNDFGVPIKFTSAKDGKVVTINGIHNKIHLGVDSVGNVVYSKNATVSVSEGLLTNAGYSVRNASGEVDMKNDLVDVKDSSGILKNYIIKSKMPDETIGLIVFVLEDYK